MAIIKTEIRRGVYIDSAKLMKLQRSLAEFAGIQDTGVIMGTDSNKELLSHIGLTSPEIFHMRPCRDTLSSIKIIVKRGFLWHNYRRKL